MDCVEKCGYNNLSLLRVVTRVFSQKHSSTSVSNGVYIVWVKKVCIRYDSLAKQNVSQVSRWKALPARHL